MTVSVYICWDSRMRPIYVGQSQYVPQRLSVHKRESPWFGEVADVTTYPRSTREAALSLEAELVAQWSPRFNRTPTGSGGRPEKEAPPCGTVPAYRRHVRRAESVDDACRAAWAEYHRARRSE